VQWTEAELAARNELDVFYAEQDPSPGVMAEVPVVAGYLRDRTKTSWSPQYGFQVTYTAANGRSYLWFPGNKQILAGEWRVEVADGWDAGVVRVKVGDDIGTRNIDSARICFRYGANTRDAVSGRPGGRFSCESYSYFKRVNRENRKGDIFRLASRSHAPFVLAKDEDKITNLLKKANSGGPR
jgi:hypothetical protein